MTTTVSRGAGRPAATARSAKHAQRTPLPPKAEKVADAKSAILSSQEVLRAAGYGEMNVSQLREYAKGYGIKVTTRMKRGEIMDALLKEEQARAKVEKTLTPDPVSEKIDAAFAEPKSDQPAEPAAKAGKPKGKGKAQAEAAEPTSVGEKVVSGGTKSEGKAAGFLAAVAAYGWEKDDAASLVDGESTELVIKRGDELIYLRWDGGVFQHPCTHTYGERTVQLRNASAAKQKAALPQEAAQKELERVRSNKVFRRSAPKDPLRRSKLPFDIEKSTDAEVISALLGQGVKWHNRLSQGVETAQVGRDAKRVSVKEFNGERIVNFCCPANGYRSFRLSDLLAVGRTRYASRGERDAGKPAIEVEEA